MVATAERRDLEKDTADRGLHLSGRVREERSGRKTMERCSQARLRANERARVVSYSRGMSVSGFTFFASREPGTGPVGPIESSMLKKPLEQGPRRLV